ncbi:MAG TPA: SRPBCC domain-containing protein [Vicinamibacterales bacterium]|nr:SRPBCC domain-containing protein [Vicinamibacterales bacterium]
MSRSIVKEVTIDAPADAVWKALTEADQLIRWFPVDARVRPGPGGSIWISWGGGTEGEAPITAWEPNRRFGWTETRGPVKLAVEFHLEAAGGRTVVRLVQSGFGDGPDWDDEFHMTTGGWSYFVEHLRWYLERHRGVPRDLIAFRDPVETTRAQAFASLLGPAGLSVDGSLRTAKAGEPYRTTTAAGDPLSGTVVASSPDTWQMGFTIDQLGDAIAFIEIEPAEGGARAGFWLSTYGLGGRVGEVRARFGSLYRSAIARS